MKYIYIIEECNQHKCEWHYDSIYYASTFEKAKEVLVDILNFWDKEANIEDLKQINEGYWRLDIDYETRYGIIKKEIDDDYNKRFEEE